MTDLNTSNDNQSANNSNSNSSSDSPTQSMADSSTQQSFDSLMSSSIDRGANSQSHASPNDTKELSDVEIGNYEEIAGLVSTISAATVSANAKLNHQNLINTPLNDAINKLEQTGDPKQIEKAQTLRNANKVTGLAGRLHPDARDYTVESTLNARDKALSKDSVIGGKLSRELSKATSKLEVAEKVTKRAGTFGLVAGPLIGSASEIAKLDQNALVSDKITAGIVGALKNVDNLVVGGVAGTAGTIFGAPLGPGAVGTATLAAVAADTSYKHNGMDDSFNKLIEKASPTIHSAVETSIKTADVLLDTSLDAAAYAVNSIDAAIKTGQESVESVTRYANDVADDLSNSAEYLFDQVFDDKTASE